MRCKAARAQTIEHIRSDSPAPDAHFEECPRCGGFYRTQLELHSALSNLASEAPRMPPAISEEAILLAFDAAIRERPRPVAHGILRWLPAAAAALPAVLVLALVLTHVPAANNSVSAPSATNLVFLQIPYTAPLAPYERTRIVRMDVPLGALIAAGFDVHAADAGAAVPADVIFGQDGRARAIRLVSISNFNRRVIE